MKKIVKVKFIYEDGTSDAISDPRAAAMFQSRCNSSGIISGMEEFVINDDENPAKEKVNT